MSLLTRRQAAADRHDAALQRWPDRNGPGFAAELNSVVRELTALTTTGIAGWDKNQVEYAKTLRYLGDAYFDLAQGRDTVLLAQGAQAYRRAEAALSDGDPIEHAKLDFNFGNTLRGLSAGEDVVLLRETRDRYQRARDVFQVNLPHFLPSVDFALRTLDAQIAIASQYALSKSAMAELERIRSFLADTSVPDGERNVIGRSMIDRFKRTFAAEMAQDTVRRALDLVSGDFGEPATTALKETFERSLEPPSAPGGEAMMVPLLGLVMARIDQELRDGRITAIRHHAIKDQFAKFVKRVEKGDEEIPDLLAGLGEFRDIAEIFTDFLKRPSYRGPPPTPGSREAALEDLVGDLNVFLGLEMFRPNKADGEREAGQKLFLSLPQCVTRMRELSRKPADAREVERELLRPAVREIQRFALRHHLTLARPLWFGTARKGTSGTLFFSGGKALRGLAEQAAKSRNIEMLADVPGQDIAGSRFDSLQRSAIALFDLTVPDGLVRAEVCYELGVARALGRPVVVVTNDNKVPFDVDLTPLIYPKNDPEALGSALDRAMYAVPRRQPGSSVTETVEEARRRFGGQGGSDVRILLNELVSTAADPILSAAKLQQLLGHAGPDAGAIIYPAWPGKYPDPGRARCFHVMPFRPEWSDTVQEVVTEECERAKPKVEYQRGDLAEDPEIIRSIWDDICISSHIVVDMTGLNYNVLFELGLAHTLGRKTLLVGQEGVEDTLGHGVLAKLRITPYDDSDDWGGLRTAARKFLRAK